MAKTVLFLLTLIVIAATVVNCNKADNKNQENQRREQAQMQKVLEEHSKIVGMGLTGRLASGYPGPAAASRGFPSVHAHVNGHKPCHQGGAC